MSPLPMSSTTSIRPYVLPQTMRKLLRSDCE